MNIEIGPGRAGDPVLYIDNYPVAEVFDVDRMNALLQRLERYEAALQHIADRDNCYDDLPMVAEEALKE